MVASAIAASDVDADLDASDVDPPRTPTMPPFNRGAFLGGIAAIFVYVQVVSYLNPPPALAFAVPMTAHIARLVSAIRRQLKIRQTVHWLRHFDAAQRATMFSSVPLPIELEHLLADHGTSENIGLVDRFSFSPVDRRELSMLIWTSVLAGAAILITMAAVDVRGVTFTIGVGCVLGLAVTAAACRRSLSRMRRVFEISPFGFSEIGEDGTIRRILWGHGLILRNRPRLRRIELSLSDAPARIEIPYSVVGFAGLLDLIVTRGGFLVDESQGPRT